MTRNDIVNAVSRKCGRSKAVCADVIGTLIDCFIEYACNTDTAKEKIHEIGTLEIFTKRGDWYNPLTQEIMALRPYKYIKMRFSHNFKQRIQKKYDEEGKGEENTNAKSNV